MGIDLCTRPNGLYDMIESRAGKVRTVLSAAQGLGDSQINVPPLTLSKIYWAVGVPKLTFGLDVTHVDDRCMGKLDNIHRQNAKLIQSLPSNTHTPAPLATLGWLSMTMDAHIAILKIMFLIRTLCLGNDSIYRHVLIARLNMLQNVGINYDEKYVSPTLSCWNYACAYKLNDVVLSFINNADSDRIVITKRLIKNRIREFEYRRWRYSCIFYSDLSLYLDIVTEMKPIIWWRFVQANPTFLKKASCIVSILMNGQPKYLQCNFNSDICKLCNVRSLDTPRHILFECDSLIETREIMNRSFIQSMPLSMFQGYNASSIDAKLKFMLSGLSEEYYDVMKCVANLVFALYTKRREKYDEM